MDFNMVCNLLNFTFKTLNAISCQILHYVNSKKIGTGVGVRPQFAGAPKNDQASASTDYKFESTGEDALSSMATTTTSHQPVHLHGLAIMRTI
jgi:hypothetical protein